MVRSILPAVAVCLAASTASAVTIDTTTAAGTTYYVSGWKYIGQSLLVPGENHLVSFGFEFSAAVAGQSLLFEVFEALLPHLRRRS